VIDYGLDLDKIEIEFNKILETKNAEKIAEFSISIIPKLVEELAKTRIELMDALNLEHPLQKGMKQVL